MPTMGRAPGGNQAGQQYAECCVHVSINHTCIVVGFQAPLIPHSFFNAISPSFPSCQCLWGCRAVWQTPHSLEVRNSLTNTTLQTRRKHLKAQPRDQAGARV